MRSEPQPFDLDRTGPLIEAAVPLAETGGLTVIAPAAIAEQADFPDWLRGRIGTARVRASVETAPGDPARLRRRIAELGCRLLAVGADTRDGGPARRREFAEILACDVLIVR
jgi:hypothetical protein